MVITKLTLTDTLPLTCSRTGTCCHGKQVLLNPWELAGLAHAKNRSPREFRDTFCEFGGIRLRFNGKAGWKGQPACSQYVESFGCSVHNGRPLACRLYPLGRQIQSSEVCYMYQGAQFPCLDGCPEVLTLPQLSVGEYLQGQQASIFEKAQDAYLKVMQDLADIAFVLLLETGLAESGDTRTLPLWRIMGYEAPETLAQRIGQEWLDALMLPDIHHNFDDPVAFAQQHFDQLHAKAQEKFGSAQTHQAFHEASVLIMGVALHLARGLGASPEDLSEHWIETAKQHGANE